MFLQNFFIVLLTLRTTLALFPSLNNVECTLLYFCARLHLLGNKLSLKNKIKINKKVFSYKESARKVQRNSNYLNAQLSWASSFFERLRKCIHILMFQQHCRFFKKVSQSLQLNLATVSLIIIYWFSYHMKIGTYSFILIKWTARSSSAV